MQQQLSLPLLLTTRGIIISKGLLSCKQLFDQYP